VVEVRQINQSDWETLRDIRLRALADSPTSFCASLAIESAFEEAKWRSRLGSDAAWFVGFDDALSVGLATGALRDAQAFMGSVWVHPDHRATGLADQLVAKVIGWAKSTGCPTLLFHVTHVNDRAKAFYVRHGAYQTGQSEQLADFPDVINEEWVIELR
jgi:GNAT superfamily N-acetyltransferase